MNVPTNIQIIKQANGAPAFVIIPWSDYVKDHVQADAPSVKQDQFLQNEFVPNAVVGYMVKEGLNPAAAWRKHLGLSQAAVAQRIGISQSAYAQQETAAKPRKATREKIAQALRIAPALLDI